jgi:hypothetical protein
MQTLERLENEAIHAGQLWEEATDAWAASNDPLQFHDLYMAGERARIARDAADARLRAARQMNVLVAAFSAEHSVDGIAMCVGVQRVDGVFTVYDVQFPGTALNCTSEDEVRIAFNLLADRVIHDPAWTETPIPNSSTSDW